MLSEELPQLLVGRLALDFSKMGPSFGHGISYLGCEFKDPLVVALETLSAEEMAVVCPAVDHADFADGAPETGISLSLGGR